MTEGWLEIDKHYSLVAGAGEWAIARLSVDITVRLHSSLQLGVESYYHPQLHGIA